MSLRVICGRKNGKRTALGGPGPWRKGQHALGLPFSGEFGFVETTYVFPTTHMVAPGENVVKCSECHTRKDGRLANLAGFYMPGRDRNRWVNPLGWVAVLGSLIGVTIHGLGRVFAAKNGRKENK